MSNNFICPIDKIISGAITPGQSVPGSDGNEGVLRIPQSSSITGASPSDCLVSCPGDTLVLLLCRAIVGVFYTSSRLGLYKDDSALNNQQGLICRKTQPNQTKTSGVTG